VRITRTISHRISGRLSARRRSRLAAPLVLLLGLLVTGGVYAVVSPATAQTRADDADQVAKGKALFLVGCASCHGKNAEGIQTVKGNQYGPSLIGVGAAAVDFQVGTGRMPMAQPGAQAPRKKPVFSKDEVAALAAYVASLGPGPAIPEEKDYSTTGMSDEELQTAIVRGGQIFLTNCTACHNFEGKGGAMPSGGYAPKILGVDSKYVYEAMLTGPQNMDNFTNGNLSPEEKRDIIAYLHSLEDNPEYGGFGMGGLGPVSEGMFAWLVGIGSLVGVATWIAAHTTRSSKTRPTSRLSAEGTDAA
jgi:ubiquinol-cytochrome c reductase cytochrome c subunit